MSRWILLTRISLRFRTFTASSKGSFSPTNFLLSKGFRSAKKTGSLCLKYMSMLPLESDFPKYELPEFYDSYSKFFKFGTDKNPIPERFRIFNKTGNAYGHLLDGSYFVDFETGTEFLYLLSFTPMRTKPSMTMSMNTIPLVFRFLQSLGNICINWN
jgi:hypothetical protein